MSWSSALAWINALSPLDFMVKVMSPPLLVAAAWAVFDAWRDRRKSKDPHAAE